MRNFLLSSVPAAGCYQYHSRTQTGRCLGLNDILGEETADISSGRCRPDWTSITARRSPSSPGAAQSRSKPKLPRKCREGMVWMAFHFREACANWLTNPVFDPVSQTAEYKACAVQIEKI